MEDMPQTSFTWNTNSHAVFLPDRVNVVTQITPYGAQWTSPPFDQVRQWLNPILLSLGLKRVGRVKASFPHGNRVLSVYSYTVTQIGQ